MKRLGLFLMFVLSMVMANYHAMAQEITIVLKPGCNWISYPNAEVMSIASALGDFTPAEGDIIKSQSKGAKYVNGQWKGTLKRFTPGIGYQYFSKRSSTVSFSFYSGVPQVTVTTATPTSVTTTSAVCGGSVTMNDQGHVFARGFCWSTHHKPTYDDNHTSDGTDIGSFSHTLEGLNPNTVYYVRAYVVSDGGLSYGNEKHFTTLEGGPSVPEGAICGKFTINSSGNQVYFSQGNLQYRASTNTWRFAENQWDYVGSDNRNISSTYSGWIDLFGWGTSGWNSGNTNYHPWDSNNSIGSTYGPPGQSNLTGLYANADWGVYNPISNGGNTANQWRTLTQIEWYYMFDTRTTTSGIRYAKANVNNVNGVILLPDDWSSSTYSLSNTNSNGASFSSNTLTTLQWSTLEQAGAVFLPAAGYRDGISVSNVGSFGNYWSSSYYNGNCACSVYFYGTYLITYYNGHRFDGFSVRLVRDAEN